MGLQTDAQRRWWFAQLRMAEAADRIDERGQKALKGYKNFGYSMVNKRLREGQTGLGDGADRDADAQIRDLDHAFDQSELGDGVTVFRGFEHDVVAKNPQALVGRVIDSPAFLSTSLDRDVVHARFMQGRNSVGMRIRVPRGTKAIAMDRFAPELGEAEVLIRRGARVRITGTTYYKGKVYLDAEVMQ